jgi:hypothetical protein
VDYETVLASFFQPSPPDAPVPAPVADGRPARRLRDAHEPIATHAIWSRGTYDALAGLGLNFLTGYVWGRAAALGEPSPAVVAAAFAVFEPGLIGVLYEQGRAAVDRASLVEVRTRATVDSLAAVLDGADVAPVVAALRRGIDAADGAGRPLFAGLAAQPWPEHPVGQLWRACDLLREHRGDSHNAAWVAAGLDPATTNILTEVWLGMPLLRYSASRGWPAEVLEAAARRLRDAGLLDADRLTPSGRQFRDEIEAQTDAAQRTVITAIDDLGGVLGQLDRWSAACVAAKAFPPDIYKRAAG